MTNWSHNALIACAGWPVKRVHDLAYRPEAWRPYLAILGQAANDIKHKRCSGSAFRLVLTNADVLKQGGRIANKPVRHRQALIPGAVKPLGASHRT